ncbi:RNA-directed RNA polymerase L [Bienertia sinuspersici]
MATSLAVIDLNKNATEDNGEVEWIVDGEEEEEAKDKAHVMDSQPWHFDRYALILSDVKGEQQPSKMSIFHIPFWVRVDKSDVVGINRSMRIRALLDARKALVQKLNLKVRGGIKESIRLGHGEKDCSCATNEASLCSSIEEWVRASPWKANGGLMNRDNSGGSQSAR